MNLLLKLIQTSEEPDDLIFKYFEQLREVLILAEGSKLKGLNQFYWSDLLVPEVVKFLCLKGFKFSRVEFSDYAVSISW